MRMKVVYILGAGFSAPLGLPVMTDFLLRSKDLYFKYPQRYPHFLEVFQAIDRMSVVKNYFDADLFNIEEILSILEMQSFTDGVAFSETFQRYICDTIAAFTPAIKPHESLPGNWRDVLFGKPPWHNYGQFVAAVCGTSFEMRQGGTSYKEIHASQKSSDDVDYTLITLNYDRVIETIPEFITEHCTVQGRIGFRRASDPISEDSRPLLAKLHGSIEIGSVVPPTWSKGSHPGIVPEWSAALKALREANQIRIIGYSLPVADAYVRFLLKSAVIGSAHLQAIDVINPDAQGDARQRYREFIAFNYYRFASATTQVYLAHYDGIRKRSGLEAAHESFMKKHLDTR